MHLFKRMFPACSMTTVLFMSGIFLTLCPHAEEDGHPHNMIAWNIVALHCTYRSLVQTRVRLTEVMLLLKHLAEALQSLQFCCRTIQYQLWIQNAQRFTSFSWRLASNLILELDNLDIGCTQVWNLSQMHLATFPKGMWALLDCSGTALRWSKWELFSSWRLMAVAYSWQM